MIRRLLSPTILFLLVLPLIVGCPQSRAPVEAVDGGKSKAKEAEPAVPDNPETLAMIEQSIAKTTTDENGNVTSVDFTDISVTDAQVPLLAGLPKLQKIRLWGDLITDNVFSELVKLKSVVDVGLENTAISDTGLQNLEKMPQVRTVYLRRNTYLTDAAFEVFPKMPKLTAIICIYHNITDQALLTVKDLVKLRVLDVRGCVEFSDAGFLALSKLTNLEQVKMRNCASFSNQGMAFFDSTPKLKGLVLEDIPIQAEGLAHIKGAKNMTELVLMRTRVDDEALANLADMPKLKTLSVRDSPVHGDGLKYIANAKELSSLNLAETAVGDEGIAHIAGLSKLTTLDLWNTKVTDAAMDTVGKLTSLTKLVLDETAITDAGIAKLEGLPLKQLYMSKLQITDAAIESLKKIKTLESIDLSFCGQISADAVNDLKAALPNVNVFGVQ